MSRSKQARSWEVDVEFYGMDVVVVKAHSESEACSIVRKKIRSGKLKPKVQSIGATRATWMD